MQGHQNIIDFLTSGRATFTLTSAATGSHFTYRVEQTEKGYTSFFVSVLTGPNNEGDYTYAGMLYAAQGQALSARQTKGSKVSADAASWLGFEWLVRRLNAGKDVHPHKFNHMGKCGMCGRPLTTPESIERGLGPVCVTRA